MGCPSKSNLDNYESARIYVLPVRSPKRKIIWERALFPFILMLGIYAARGNAALDKQLSQDKAAYAALSR